MKDFDKLRIIDKLKYFLVYVDSCGHTKYCKAWIELTLVRYDIKNLLKRMKNERL